MSIKQDSSPIDIAKKKAKHLHSILKTRIPDISLGECLNSYARIEGARDWNTFSAALKTQSTEESPYVKIGTFIDETLLPMMTQIASAHGMGFSAPNAYFVARKDGDESVVHSQASKELEATFQPKNQTNTDYSFSLEVSATGIYQERSDITFVFPEDAYGAAASIFSGKRMPHELTASLLRNIDRGVTTYCLILGIEPFFYTSGVAKGIWDASEKIQYIRQELDETVGKYAKLNIAFQRLSKQLNNKRLLVSFETALWEVFTGTPRYMSASSEFHSASFGDVTLKAHMEKSGPCISGSGGSLNLGVSSIIYREAKDKTPAGYYIAKYGHDFEADIYLKGIAKEDLLKITSEFGVPLEFDLAQELGVPLEKIKDAYTAFFRSRAFLGLQDWVAKNRSFAKQIRRGASYIPDWYERATGRHPVPDSDEELDKERRAIRHFKLRKASRKRVLA
jgi:hypothetical protein